MKPAGRAAFSGARAQEKAETSETKVVSGANVICAPHRTRPAPAFDDCGTPNIGAPADVSDHGADGRSVGIPGQLYKGTRAGH